MTGVIDVALDNDEVSVRRPDKDRVDDGIVAVSSAVVEVPVDEPIATSVVLLAPAPALETIEEPQYVCAKATIKMDWVSVG